MKNSKKITFITFLFLTTTLLNAQYFIDATGIGNKSVSQIQASLKWWGWDTSSMTLNSVKSYKITYNTTDVHGNPTVASGALYVHQTTCNIMPLIFWKR